MLIKARINESITLLKLELTSNPLQNLIVHDPSMKFGDINRYKMLPQMKHKSSNLNVIGEAHTFYELDGPCASKSEGLQNIEDMEVSPIFGTYIISFVLLVAVLLFFVINKIPMRKYWISFSLLSILSYIIMIILVFTLNDLSLNAKNNLAVLYLFLESAVYIWLVITCMESYLMLK